MKSAKVLSTFFPTQQRQLLQRREPHASLLKSGNPPTQLAPQRTGSLALSTQYGKSVRAKGKEIFSLFLSSTPCL
ncbi:hypothetical protein I8752_07965 [Nostocaceae cyanobacterium CENA369]|uniref:Uncharacterized protein n=1 Tax=Dendronalium phyllosphericum CENA369 TaxID=1725256 RepID=A0A8J7HZ20_9NOST|nr:hypothetical protein [Dendronalium phyllosphericum]MBH8572954.1 hypothetical protein [Dendronalium phyllosphericum CENA369]